jgi:hypothetical protein
VELVGILCVCCVAVSWVGVELVGILCVCVGWLLAGLEWNWLLYCVLCWVAASVVCVDLVGIMCVLCWVAASGVGVELVGIL